MTPAIVASWFGNLESYRRMAAVLRTSAEQACPDWDIRVERLEPGPLVSAQHNPAHVANTQKMVHWTEAVTRARDGDRLLLMDADTLVLRPLDPLWALDFDLAYTARPGRLPFNTGVVGVRISRRTRAFVQAWLAEQLHMLDHAAYHEPYRARFGGINQAALGRLLERVGEFPGLTLRVLPGCEWNAEEGCWATVDDRTRIVHVKGQLRRAIFGRWAQPSGLAPLVARWRAFEQRAPDAEATDAAGVDLPPGA